jgi:hypothetical protein
MKCGCVFCEFAKRKLVTWKDKIVSQSWGEMRGACLLSCRTEDYQYSLEERVFIVKNYWIAGSSKDCQRRFVEQFGGRNPPSKRCIQILVAGCIAISFRVDYLYLILSFRVANFLFVNSRKHTTPLHYRYDMQMYCTFVLFVNQHFSGLPASGMHCIMHLILTFKFFRTSKHPNLN